MDPGDRIDPSRGTSEFDASHRTEDHLECPIAIYQRTYGKQQLTEYMGVHRKSHRVPGILGFKRTHFHIMIAIYGRGVVWMSNLKPKKRIEVIPSNPWAWIPKGLHHSARLSLE
uniref:Uncharacterized protein n=1 Tax=Picea glauca TaxID=3330 RepID=A0A117NJ60_PICGL|nr:hypothetical protein ABT39_MTgene808 [Picea glauca]QHR90556.1 hypothetical protein Q903MT_gene4581 [Picea sitchensis]